MIECGEFGVNRKIFKSKVKLVVKIVLEDILKHMLHFYFYFSRSVNNKIHKHVNTKTLKCHLICGTMRFGGASSKGT